MEYNCWELILYLPANVKIDNSKTIPASGDAGDPTFVQFTLACISHKKFEIQVESGEWVVESKT